MLAEYFSPVWLVVFCFGPGQLYPFYYCPTTVSAVLSFGIMSLNHPWSIAPFLALSSLFWIHLVLFVNLLYHPHHTALTEAMFWVCPLSWQEVMAPSAWIVNLKHQTDGTSTMFTGYLSTFSTFPDFIRHKQRHKQIQKYTSPTAVIHDHSCLVCEAWSLSKSQACPHDSGMMCMSQLTCLPGTHTFTQARATNLLLQSNLSPSLSLRLPWELTGHEIILKRGEWGWGLERWWEVKKGQRQSGQESMRKSEGREYCTDQLENVDMENRSRAKEKSCSLSDWRISCCFSVHDKWATYQGKVDEYIFHRLLSYVKSLNPVLIYYCQT